MCIPVAEFLPGAYVFDPQTRRFYEVADVGDRSSNLIDVYSPIDEPEMVGMLTANACKRLELVRHAPCVADTASVDEWGERG